MKTQKYLTHAAQFDKLLENQANGLLHAEVRIDLDLARRRPAKTNRQTKLQLAAPGLLPNGLQASLPDQIRFELAHGSPQPQQQAIVDEARIVHALWVDDQSVDQAAHFDQVMPLSAVPGQPRSFDTEYGTHLPGADFGHQMLIARTFDQATTRTAKIIINDLHILEAHLAGVIGEPVLPPLAFLVVHHLGRCRLADVNDGFASQMVRRELGMHHRFLHCQQGRRP